MRVRVSDNDGNTNISIITIINKRRIGRTFLLFGNCQFQIFLPLN